MPDPFIILAFVAIGAVAGLLAGLLGVGGGLVVVPMLSLLFESMGFAPQVIIHCAIATSMATIVVTAAVSFYAHYRLQAVVLRLFWQLTLGVMVGALLGAWFAALLDNEVLKVFFALFEFAVALQMGLGLQAAASSQLPGLLGTSLVGAGIGGVSSLLGIGGGTMTVPYLVWKQVDVHKAVGTSAALGLPLALAATFSFVFMAPLQASLPPYSLGYVYLPAFLGIVFATVMFAPLGAKLAHRLPTSLLRKIFAAFLALLGFLMLGL